METCGYKFFPFEAGVVECSKQAPFVDYEKFSDTVLMSLFQNNRTMEWPWFDTVVQKCITETLVVMTRLLFSHTCPIACSRSVS